MGYILNVRDENGNFIPISAIKGDKGDKGDTGDKGEKGAKGDKGDNYVLTEADKQEIAETVYNMLTNGDEVSY